MKIERPKSLFGKYPYPAEQHLILNLLQEVERIAFIVEPRLSKVAGIELIPIEMLRSPEWRMNKFKEHAEKSIKILNEIGV